MPTHMCEHVYKHKCFTRTHTLHKMTGGKGEGKRGSEREKDEEEEEEKKERGVGGRTGRQV